MFLGLSGICVLFMLGSLFYPSWEVALRSMSVFGTLALTFFLLHLTVKHLSELWSAWRRRRRGTPSDRSPLPAHRARNDDLFDDDDFEPAHEKGSSEPIIGTWTPQEIWWFENRH